MKNIKDEYQKITGLLPPAIVEDLKNLKIARDDDKVSVEEWNAMSDEMLAKGKHLIKVQKNALHRAVKLLGKEERQELKESKKMDKALKKESKKNKQ